VVERLPASASGGRKGKSAFEEGGVVSGLSSPVAYGGAHGGGLCLQVGKKTGTLAALIGTEGRKKKFNRCTAIEFRGIKYLVWRRRGIESARSNRRRTEQHAKDGTVALRAVLVASRPRQRKPQGSKIQVQG